MLVVGALFLACCRASLLVQLRSTAVRRYDGRRAGVGRRGLRGVAGEVVVDPETDAQAWKFSHLGFQSCLTILMRF
eukprot:1019166-Pleurochrysis_carterae.AAC.1